MTTETTEKRNPYWYTESQNTTRVSENDPHEFEYAGGWDGRTEFVNIDGKYLTRDEEIIGRYEVIVEHFEEHPELLVRDRNYTELSNVWMGDRILAKDEALKGRLGKILMEAAFKRMEEWMGGSEKLNKNGNEE